MRFERSFLRWLLTPLLVLAWLLVSPLFAFITWWERHPDDVEDEVEYE